VKIISTVNKLKGGDKHTHTARWCQKSTFPLGKESWVKSFKMDRHPIAWYSYWVLWKSAGGPLQWCP